MDVPEMRRLLAVKRTDFWIAMAAILGVLSAGVLAGVMIGVLLSIIWLVAVSTRPDAPALGHQPGTQVFRSLDRYPDGLTYPGLVVLRFDSGLFFASADALNDAAREAALTADTPLRVLVVSCEGVDFIDSQGSAELGRLADLGAEQDIELRLARVKPAVLGVLERDRVLDRLGGEGVYGNVYEAAADHIPGPPVGDAEHHTAG